MALQETMLPKPPPLRVDGDGVVRVGGTRVTLDTVVTAYIEGATAEEIVLRYDSLRLADVHAVISYYLEHRTEVEAYLEQRHQEAEELRRQVEARTPQAGIRKRLLARRSKSR
jgi:uncharacterized protein (DUF433 family)